MTRRSKHRETADRLGVRAEAGEWCWIGEIPQPPADIAQAAGNPRTRPARRPPLTLAGTVLGAPFLPVLWLLMLLARAEQAVERFLDTKEEKERHRARKEEERRRDAAVEQRGLDNVFDGDWKGAAGQFLLHWYSHSTHHERLLFAGQDGLVFAAPPERVGMGRDRRAQAVARLSPEEATLEDPFGGEFETQIMLIRFRDGSWLRVDTEEARSELHMYALRNAH
ncbi:hypothetical protein [Actinospica acidiphila]|uniref:hypothetical protein n=1 Tax=Actinospica acidiphila TaxID=304899 RepID=UPI00193FBBA1|nr:hypothetical protein [Actinospica acidiphila]